MTKVNKTKDQDKTTVSIAFTNRDLARCQRAAEFCGIELQEWAWQSIMTSMECDEESMEVDGAGSITNSHHRSTLLGKKSPGWRYRASLPEPKARRLSL